MIRNIQMAGEVVIIRVVPGVINIVALMALANWMTAALYGVASTYIATSGAIANVVFGPILQGALVAHAEHAGRGERERFERNHITNSVILGSLVALAGFLLFVAGMINWRIAACVGTFGIYTSIQQISQARVRFVIFAVGSTVQSIAFLAISYIIVRTNPIVNSALEAFALSYLIGGVCSAALVRVKITKPEFRSLRTAFRMGVGPTSSNLAGDVFTLGCRYILIWLGRLDSLGIFAFSVDLAQRSSGFVISLATFAVVPRALRVAGGADTKRLWKMLFRAWVVAVPTSLVGMGAIVALSFTSWVPALSGAEWSPVSFMMISLAVIVSRTGKMIFTPVAIQLRQTKALVIPLLIASPIGLWVVLIAGELKAPYFAEMGYFAVCTVSMIGTYWALSRSLRRSTHRLN